MNTDKKYKTFSSFYPYYLTEHSDASNRRLHFTGTALLIGCFVTGVVTRRWWWFAAIPVVGYGFAWIGHFFVEKNKPATFTYPLYSLASDFVMFWDTITGQLSRKMAEAKIVHQDKS